MRILFTTHDDLGSPSGARSHSRALIAGWERLGHRVLVLAPASRPWEGPGQLHSCGHWAVREEGLAAGTLHLATIYLRLASRLRALARSVDVVYARDHFTSALACGLGVRRTVPVLREINGLAWAERIGREGGWLNRLYQRFAWSCDRFAIPRCDGRAFVSQGLRGAVSTRVAFPRERTLVVPNGVDPDRFDLPEGSRERARARLGLGERTVVTFVGTMNPWHGVETLIEAVAQLGDIDGLTVLMVGDGPARASAERRAAELACGERIRWLGRIDEGAVPEILAASDVCVSCHRAGLLGSPLKLREYLAAGKPIVQSRIADTEFLEEQRLGVLFEPGDSQDLARALREVIGNPELMQCGERARCFARSNLSWLEVARATAALCEEAIGARQG